MLLICDYLLLAVYCVFSWCSSHLYFARRLRTPAEPWIQRWWTRTKWPSLVYVLAHPVISVAVYGSLDFWAAFNTVLFAVYWWLCRNLGDDDWRDRLKRKLKEIVTQIINRFVVVGAPA